MASTFSITDIKEVVSGTWNVTFSVETANAVYSNNVYQWQLASGDTTALNAEIQGIVSYLEAQEAATVPALPAAFAALVPAVPAIAVNPVIGA